MGVAFRTQRLSRSLRLISHMSPNALPLKGPIISSFIEIQSHCMPNNRNLNWNPCHQHFSTAVRPVLSWEGSCHAILLNKLKIALKDHRIDEAWDVFNDFKSLHGFPGQHIVNKLIIELCYSSESRWLRKAYDLVLLVLKEKPHLLHYDFLTTLALVLARAQMPIPASSVLRIMLEKEKFPSMDMLSTVFLHMVKTPTGTYLASDILIEICECFLHHKDCHGLKVSKHLKLLTPNTMIFNLILDACVRFGANLKAQQIILDVMPRTGVAADAVSISLMALIHDRNGQRDELRKLKEYVDRASVSLDHLYQHFYNSLLSLHFKFNDIDAAVGIVLDLYKRQQSLKCSGQHVVKVGELGKPCLVPIGSRHLRDGLRMHIMPELLQNHFVVGVGIRPEFVVFKDGKLVPTHKALAKLINRYAQDRRTGELSNLIVSIQKLGFSAEACSLSCDVIHACIQLGWLEIAHDILDDMETATVPVDVVTCESLLRAYCKGNRLNEAKVLIRQMRKFGLLVGLSDEKVISICLLEDGTISSLDPKDATSVQESILAKLLLRETKGEKSTSPLVYDINSSIYFFCKANMMEDASKIFRRMQGKILLPTVQTFSYMVNGYSLLQMYREITILWGEIRRMIDDGALAADRDLYECLLWNFIRGGYFERVMEVIGYMTKQNMYTDKWKCRREFLKLHKDLYKNLKASNAKTEVQTNRLEHVQAFRKWAGIE